MENITIENLYDLKETIAQICSPRQNIPGRCFPESTIHSGTGKRLPEEIYEKRGEDIMGGKERNSI